MLICKLLIYVLFYCFGEKQKHVMRKKIEKTDIKRKCDKE